jgi:type IV pilus assembly protein PilF
VKILNSNFRVLFGFFLALILSGCASQKNYGVQSERNGTAESAELQKRAAIRMQLALDYYQQGQHKVALEEVRKALLVVPDLVDAFSVRALIFMDLGEVQLAEDNFTRALQLAPNDSEIANNYGWFLCQNGRAKQSMAYFERVLKDPAYTTPVKAFHNAGVCSLRIKDVENAERYFMLAFREQPANPSINANLAKIFYDKGEYEKAKFYINRVVKAEILAADVLWLAIKIENKLGDQLAVSSLATQLRRRHPNSKEYGLFERGAFND